MQPKSNLNRIWEAVIEKIYPLSIRALLRQQCHILEINGERKSDDSCLFVVKLYCGSARLMRSLRGKTQLIECAFETRLKTNVRILLQCEDTHPYFGDTLTCQLGNVAALKAIDKLNSSTRSLVKSSKVTLFCDQGVWYVDVGAPSLKVLNRILKRTESIARRFNQVFGAFVLSFGLWDNNQPVLSKNEVESVFLIENTWFTRHCCERYANGERCDWDWVHVFPVDILPALMPSSPSAKQKQ